QIDPPLGALVIATRTRRANALLLLLPRVEILANSRELLTCGGDCLRVSCAGNPNSNEILELLLNHAHGIGGSVINARRPWFIGAVAVHEVTGGGIVAFVRTAVFQSVKKLTYTFRLL